MEEEANELKSTIQPTESKVENDSTAFEEEAVDLSLWKPESSEEYESGIESSDEGTIPTEIHLSTWEKSESSLTFGITFLGRGHSKNETVCQDFHKFFDLGNGWHIYVVSDGAGSASQAHRGAKMNCDLAVALIQRLIQKSDWINSNYLPTEKEWHIEFEEICRAIKNMTCEKIESLDEPVKPRDFNATLVVILVSPKGMMCGHIGDGRMGYLSKDNVWHAIITPHKGEEANQTVFMMNDWDKIKIPAFKMSNVYVPETKVIETEPKAVALITDGCENSCWNCVQFDSETEQYRDVNTPFVPFWNDLVAMIQNENEGRDAMIKYIDSSSESCQFEEDDRTLMLGLYNYNLEDSGDEENVHSL